jgi:hypothetical protein
VLLITLRTSAEPTVTSEPPIVAKA